jgi:hypothetical protein
MDTPNSSHYFACGPISDDIRNGPASATQKIIMDPIVPYRFYKFLFAVTSTRAYMVVREGGKVLGTRSFAITPAVDVPVNGNRVAPMTFSRGGAGRTVYLNFRVRLLSDATP